MCCMQVPRLSRRIIRTLMQPVCIGGLHSRDLSQSGSEVTHAGLYESWDLGWHLSNFNLYEGGVREDQYFTTLYAYVSQSKLKSYHIWICRLVRVPPSINLAVSPGGYICSHTVYLLAGATSNPILAYSHSWRSWL